MKRRFFPAVLLVLLSFTTGAHAKQLWSSFSLSYLKGENYEVGDESREVLTVEHASGHTWGDNFFFLDHLKSSDGTISNYFELAPRLSLSYLFNTELKAGPLKDVYIATTYESGTFENLLLGIGFGLAIPGFKYFNINFYQADNDVWDDDEQVTITWGVPFNLGGGEFLYDGFLDHSTSSDTNEAETNFTSQLKWNLGKVLGTSAPFYVGIEYAYWTNKFGIDGVDEENPCLLLKWHF